MGDLTKLDSNLCMTVAIVFILLFLFIFALGRPKNTVWKEHCPYCNADLGPKFKGEKPGYCKKCGRDLTYSQPHGG